MASDPKAPSGGAADPSMDDILASIRRILDEEGAKTGSEGDESADVFDLDRSMMLQKPDKAAEVEPRRLVVGSSEAETPGAALAGEAPPDGGKERAVAGPERSDPGASDRMVAPEAAAAAAASVGSLLQALANERNVATHRGGPTVEDLVRDEMRPMLKAWLDGHLAPLVERLVRAEIERVVNRMT